MKVIQQPSDWLVNDPHVLKVALFEYNGETNCEAYPLDTDNAFDVYGVYVRDFDGFAFSVLDYETLDEANATCERLKAMPNLTYREALNVTWPAPQDGAE